MPNERLRTIVTTDGECDDMNSFVRLLFYANEMDLRGIVLTSSCYHHIGKRWAGETWPHEYIDAYAEIWPSLLAHDPAYPSPEHLHSIVAVGNIRDVSDTSEATPGSELIRREILSDNHEPLYLQCWGGANTVARALMDIDCTETERSRLSRKLVLYLIGTQDDCYEGYIRKNWPEITTIHNLHGFEALSFKWKRLLAPDQQRTLCASWQKKHILYENVLMEKYHSHHDGHEYPGEEDALQFGRRRMPWKMFLYKLMTRGDFFRRGDFLSEGDSPAFLFLIGDGKRGLASLDSGNWGGKYTRQTEFYYSDSDDAIQWMGEQITEINEDFARRIVWAEHTD